MSGTEVVLNTLMSVDRGRNATWIDYALCRDFDDDTFFPDPPGGGGPAPIADDGRILGYGPKAIYLRKVAYAASICADCPVKAECLADAEGRDERHGIWGGRDFYAPRAHSKQPRAKAS